MPHLLPVPPPPAGPPPRSVPPAPHAPLLLRAMAHVLLPDPPTRTSLVGCSFVEDGIDLAVTATPDDHRCDAAGLFGFTAPAHWCGAGVVCTGRVRHLLDGHDGAPAPVQDATAVVVVDRDGSVASHLASGAGHPVDLPDHEPRTAPTGLVVDTLHRALGLPTVGPVPPVEMLAVGLWVDGLVELAVAGHVPSWPDAVACCPGAPGRGHVPASAETVAASAAALVDGRTWGSLRAAAADGTLPAAGLDPAEAAWMDDPMFARWVVAALPDLEPALAVLRAVGADAAAAGVAEVARLVLPAI